MNFLCINWWVLRKLSLRKNLKKGKKFKYISATFKKISEIFEKKEFL